MTDSLQALIDGYLNGTLNDSEIVKLETFLQGNAVAKREFATQLVLHGHLSLIAEEQRGFHGDDPAPMVKPVRRFRLSFRQIAVILATASTLLFALAWYAVKHSESVIRHDVAYDLQQIAIRTVGYAEGDRGQTRRVVAGSDASLLGSPLTGSTEVTTDNGTTLRISSETLYGFSTETLGLLFRGETLVSCTESGRDYAIEMGDVRTVATNGQFRVIRNQDDVAVVEAIQGAVKIQKRFRVPRVYWTFDDEESVRAMPLTLGNQVTRSGGLVGTGALHFTDKRGVSAVVQNGRGATVGSGVFAMSGGMTIEAVISSTWNGKEENQDTLFRKEDGPNRILLSFQNNIRAFEVPEVPPGPVLSFGIFLQGLGYSELDMPLDGEQGRPTVAEIADGMPHTIAATYDSSTGVKAIAVDGQIRFSHQFPIGHCIQSGGPRSATIGSWNRREAFGGVIDELAIYNYALSADEISAHHKLAVAGQRWYPDSSLEAGSWMTTQSVPQGQRVELALSTKETL